MSPIALFASINSKQAHVWHRLILGLSLMLALGTASILPSLNGLNRIGIDGMFTLRHWITGPIFPKEESDVAVVVIDEQTYQTLPFRDTPEVAWTRYLAEILAAIDKGGAKVVGLDLIYPTSLDRPDLIPGYDRPLLKVFLKNGRAGRLVLGEVSLSNSSIGPYKGQYMAVGRQANIRPLNILVDDDDVVRRYPAQFESKDGPPVTSFGMELAKRAGIVIPDSNFLINYNTGPDDFPTYTFADLFACAQSGNTDFFVQHFKDKIVLVGTALDLDDRHIPAKRFALGKPDAARHDRCSLPVNEAEFGATIERNSMPGVFIHGAAINTVAKDIPLAMMEPIWRFLFVSTGVLLLSIPFFKYSPVFGLTAGFGLLGLGLTISFGFFHVGIVAPVIIILAGAVVTPGVIYGYRFIVEDQQKRWISNAFAHYLAPVMVDRLANDPSLLELGGKVERITIFFSDIAGFTTLSEQLKEHPDQLVAILNRYLTVVTDTIEQHGGYVDKFIGDAVMAVWGAPLKDEKAEENAVIAAVAIQKGLDQFNEDMLITHPDLPPIKTRIGLNTGEALVGNMGSATRLNYTVAGDPVNLAARLEGANKNYGTALMIGEETAAALGDEYLLRFLDNIAVKGKDLPVKVYEPITTPFDPVSKEVRASVLAFNKAMALYHDRKFKESEIAFKTLLPLPAASLYVERSQLFIETPPPDDWDGSFKLTSK